MHEWIVSTFSVTGAYGIGLFAGNDWLRR